MVVLDDAAALGGVRGDLVEQHREVVKREDPQRPAHVESAELRALAGRRFAQQQGGEEEAAEDEEHVDAEVAVVAQLLLAERRRRAVVKHHPEHRERAQPIERGEGARSLERAVVEGGGGHALALSAKRRGGLAGD